MRPIAHTRLPSLLVITGSKAALSSEPKNASVAGPNILFIIADDQHPFDFKIYNPRSSLDTPAVISLTGNTPAPNQRSLAGDPAHAHAHAHAEKLAGMKALLLSEMRRLDDPRRLWNQPK